jgi:hypothetical protein
LCVLIQTQTGSRCSEKCLALEQHAALQQVAEMPKVHRSGEERVTTLILIFKVIILEHLLETDGITFLRQIQGVSKVTILKNDEN